MIRPGKTDAQMSQIDLEAVIRSGFTSPEAFRALSAEGAIAAAIRADQVGIDPPALAFLAETIRRGGFAFVLELPQLLPTEAQSTLLKGWLNAGNESGDEDRFARWLDAVAMVLGLRRVSGR